MLGILEVSLTDSVMVSYVDTGAGTRAWNRLFTPAGLVFVYLLRRIGHTNSACNYHITLPVDPFITEV